MTYDHDPMAGQTLHRLKQELDRAEAGRLSPRACPSTAAVRRRPDRAEAGGHRQNFQMDADRVLHSLAYTRYIDKTQVFYLVPNDTITHRVLHVQLVSKIARTIGRLLRLNEDLIEAIALGHDLGHAPFGHDGEAYLDELSQEHGLPHFIHALQSVRALEKLEKKGRGWNLSLQVLDGIMCHDGELDDMGLSPQPDKDFAVLDREIAAKEANPKHNLTPMTAEGCVVRLSDTISYIGRDFEDAIRLELINRDQAPKAATEVLGNTNGTIVFRLVEDLIATSLDRDRIGFSEPVGAALQAMKDFNRENIYLNSRIKTEAAKVKRLFRVLFERFLDDLKNKRTDSAVYRDFLNLEGGLNGSSDYLDATPAPLAVRDFIAGMTDAYFLRQADDLLIPKRIL